MIPHLSYSNSKKMLKSFILLLSVNFAVSSVSFNNPFDKWDQDGKNVLKKGLGKSEENQSHNHKENGLFNQFRHRRDQYSGLGPASYKVPLPKNHMLLDYGYTPRQLTSFAATNLLQQSQVSPSEYGYAVAGGGQVPGEEEDNIVAAGGHGHSQYGWGQGKDCNSALGLLGVLGLASYLQNVLRQMNGLGLGGGLGGGGGGGGIGGGGGTGGGGGVGGGGGGVSIGGRRKRSLDVHNPIMYDTTSEMVPHLLHLNQIRAKKWPMHCTSHPVCKLSHSVSKGLGKPEKELIKTTLKAVVSEILGSMIKDGNSLRKLIEKAATEGMRNGDGSQCDKSYTDCRMPRKMYKHHEKTNIIF